MKRWVDGQSSKNLRGPLDLAECPGPNRVAVTSFGRGGRFVTKLETNLGARGRSSLLAPLSLPIGASRVREVGNRVDPGFEHETIRYSKTVSISQSMKRSFHSLTGTCM